MEMRAIVGRLGLPRPPSSAPGGGGGGGGGGTRNWREGGGWYWGARDGCPPGAPCGGVYACQDPAGDGRDCVPPGWAGRGCIPPACAGSGWVPPAREGCPPCSGGGGWSWLVGGRRQSGCPPAGMLLPCCRVIHAPKFCDAGTLLRRSGHRKCSQGVYAAMLSGTLPGPHRRETGGASCNPAPRWLFQASAEGLGDLSVQTISLILAPEIASGCTLCYN